MPYAAPGRLNELNDQLLARWNTKLAGVFAAQIGVAKDESSPASARAWLYDPIGAPGGNPAEASITWTAFPKRIADESPTPAKAWERADNNRNNQEEYCEWEVVRDPTQQNKIVRVTFTCETEDYYTFLAAEAPHLLLSLFRKHVSPQVEINDLILEGQYQPQSKWNYPQVAGAHGIIMHMAQRNNAWEAAVNLTAIATWPRVDDGGHPVTGEQALIACRPFGDSRRHSDPHIGAEINALVRAGNEVSFADPVGLYMDSFDTSDWETPDGSPAAACLRIVRGSPEFALRVVFETPPNAGFALGDVKIGGRKIQFGGQIAEKIRVRIRGLARPAQIPAPRLTCGAQPEEANFAELVAVDTVKLKLAASRIVESVNLMSSE